MRFVMSKTLFCLTTAILLFTVPGFAPYPALGEPGPKADTVDSLQLPVPRAFELTHVKPEHFAVALGKDPARLFGFVRDQIAYEVYTGVLRGPRGTLLALAGNSADQAALLGSLLTHSGHRVRYARGRLAEAEARKLVQSMWVERPRPAPPKDADEPSLELKAALDTFVAGVKRDYTLIKDHLKRANVKPAPDSAPSLDSLVKEAQDHYWVQWHKDGAWVDLDPSFGDSSQGKKYASAEKIFDALPDDIFHRVAIRIRLEEYTGDQRSERVILTYTVKAADLSGSDLVLSHQPENWKGPVASLQGAIASAIQETGRVKPVLLTEEESWVIGEPFRQKPSPTGGMPGVFSMLRGEGTRTPVPLATAESLEFDFVYPGGHKETVVREIFDRVGPGRRAANRPLSAAEVRQRSQAKDAFDVTRAVYDLYFSTGRTDASHFIGAVEVQASRESEPPDLREGLRNINITFASSSDALMERIDRGSRGTVLFYPDSPRLQIAELSTAGEKLRTSLDLRQNQTRALALPPHPEAVFFARAFRGVVNGTLERVLMEYVVTDARRKGGLEAVVSTSSVFERAQDDRVSSVLLPAEVADLASGVPEHALARLREEALQGQLAVAPKRAIDISGAPRFAWWRIDPRSGETIAVTDEGLHQAEYTLVHDKSKKETHIFYRTVTSPGYKYVGSFRWGTHGMRLFMNSIRSSGGTITNIFP